MEKSTTIGTLESGLHIVKFWETKIHEVPEYDEKYEQDMWKVL